jgi:TPR repeat protein
MARLDFAAQGVAAQAVHGGGADSLFELGLTYCSGRDVAVNLVEAHKWFNLAAARGNEAAKRYRLEVASEMTKSEIARAQRLAREWLVRH